MDILALLSLVFAIAMGVITNKNIGMIALALTLVLGYSFQVPMNDLVAGFPTGLFINLTGMFFFFSIAKQNESLDLFSKKVFLKLAKVKKLFPILVFIISALITALDPGGLTSYVVLPSIAMGIGYQMGFNPILIGIITIYGSNATLMTPFGVFGSIAKTLIADNKYPDLTKPIIMNAIVMFSIGAVIAYILFKGWETDKNTYKTKKDENIDVSNVGNFNSHQVLTLAMLFIMIICIMLLKTNVGLTAITFSIILILFGAANERDAFSGVPWETIFLVVGISTLLTLIETLGGMKLLSEIFSRIMSRWTAAPLLGFTSSIMSFFALAMAGPVPTLMKTLDTVNASIGNPFLPLELVSTIINGGFTAAIGPLSLGGAMIMAATDTLFDLTSEERNKTFNKLFGTAILISLIAAVLANTGIYKIFA